MAFKVEKRKLLNNQSFASGVGKIGAYAGFKDAKKLYNATRIASLVGNEVQAASDKLRSELDKYGGSIEPNTGRIVVDDPEMKKKWNAFYESFLDEHVDIERHRIPLEDVLEVGLAPFEIDALGEMIVLPED
jgi:hypothetical protein